MTSKVKFENIQKSVKALNDKYEGTLVQRAGSIEATEIPRVSTGVFDLDRVLGGGIPMGRITTFWGDKSNGKSLTSYICAKAFQKRFPEKAVLWVDTEGVFDPEWATEIGLDLDGIFVTQPEYSEQVVDIVDSFLRQGDMSLVVVDSLAAMTPKDEIESSSEDWQVGLNARIINKGFRRWVATINSFGMDAEFKPTLILINQVREKVGVMYGDNRIKPGGRAQDFASSIDLFFLNAKEVKTKTHGFDSSVASEIRFVTHKNKTYANRRTGSYFIGLVTGDFSIGGKLLHFEKGQVNDFDQVWTAAKKIGVVRKTEDGKKWLYDNNEYKTQKDIIEFCLSTEENEDRLRELTVSEIK